MAESESTIRRSLRKQVADRRAEWPGQDVGGPETEHGIDAHGKVANRCQRNQAAEDQRALQVAKPDPFGREIATSRSEGEGEQDCRPVKSSRLLV